MKDKYDYLIKDKMTSADYRNLGNAIMYDKWYSFKCKVKRLFRRNDDKKTKNDK